METAVYCYNCSKTVIPNISSHTNRDINGRLFIFKSYYCSKCGTFIKAVTMNIPEVNNEHI